MEALSCLRVCIFEHTKKAPRGAFLVEAIPTYLLTGEAGSYR
jgi:hypothetical protein